MWSFQFSTEHFQIFYRNCFTIGKVMSNLMPEIHLRDILQVTFLIEKHCDHFFLNCLSHKVQENKVLVLKTFALRKWYTKKCRSNNLGRLNLIQNNIFTWKCNLNRLLIWDSLANFKFSKFQIDDNLFRKRSKYTNYIDKTKRNKIKM